jgi:hypothetical protein
MSADADLRKPRVRSQDDRLVIEVPREDAEQLQIHLHSLGIRTAAEPSPTDCVTRLKVLDHGAEDVEAILGEWEVARA